MRYGLIGCGRISPNHISAAINNNLDLVSFCDIIPEKIKEKKEMFKDKNLNVKEYTDYK